MRAFVALLILGAVALVPATAGAQCFGTPSCTFVEPPATQTIAAGGIVTDNACGTVKRLTSAGAVTTDTTNTFSVPSGGNAGCTMDVCNVGAQNITLDSNSNFPGEDGSSVVLTALDCIRVAQTGTQWLQVSPLVSNDTP